MGFAKDTVDMVAGRGTRKSVQASVQSACFLPCFYFISGMGGLGHIFLAPLVHPEHIYISALALRPAVSSLF